MIATNVQSWNDFKDDWRRNDSKGIFDKGKDARPGHEARGLLTWLTLGRDVNVPPKNFFILCFQWLRGLSTDFVLTKPPELWYL